MYALLLTSVILILLFLKIFSYQECHETHLFLLSQSAQPRFLFKFIFFHAHSGKKTHKTGLYQGYLFF